MNKWLNESIEPEPVGKEGYLEKRSRRTRLTALFTGIPALFILLFVIIKTTSEWDSYKSQGNEFVNTILLISLYLLAAHLFTPYHNSPNKGLIGTLLDPQVRIHNGLQRFVALLMLFLLPGKLLVIALGDLIRAFLPRHGTEDMPDSEPKN